MSRKLFWGWVLAVSFASHAATPQDVWARIARLENDDRDDAALKLARQALSDARAHHDPSAELRALLETAKLQMALGEPEGAVTLLKDAPRPKSAVDAAILDLYEAKAFQNYLAVYRYEILRRERVGPRSKVPLKQWTADQLQSEIQDAFVRAWKVREALGTVPLTEVSRYIAPNDYPKGIRSTFRDALTYLWADVLGDTSLWTPEASNAVWKLPFEALVTGDPGKASAVRLEDPDVHPLIKLGAILSDLEAWHRASGRPEAALEARIVRLTSLADHFDSDAQKAAIEKDLAAHLAPLQRLPWWSWGQAVLARMYRTDGDAVRAHDVALAGEKAHPKSVGGLACHALVAELEAPDLNVSSMLSDSAHRRSVLVTARNLPRVYFRAYAFDLEAFMRDSKDYNALPNAPDAEHWMATQKPVAAWTVELPQTHDYASHQTYVTPPLDKKGAYLIVTSVREDFASQHNRREVIPFVISDLVIRSRQLATGALWVEARDGLSGAIAADVPVRLYRLDWRKGHSVAATQTTDARGEATFPTGDDQAAYFAVAQRGEDLAIDPGSWWLSRPNAPSPTQAALVFTDRAVYRPNQTVRWKVVAFEGNAQRTDFHTLPATTLDVTLEDANGQEVAKRTVTTNVFGSAAGEFQIPTGRLLGGWSVRTSDPSGSAPIRVEEYKRPTFEVSVDHPSDAARINTPVTLVGHARYYFGLPVPTGKVTWRITRAPVFPLWWEWIVPSRPPQIVAGGTSQLKEDGTFPITFTPEADEHADPSVTYRFQLSADVTDEGGETRSASLGFRLGKVAVDATIAVDAPFTMAGQAVPVTITRTDLDGTPRAGSGTYQVNALQAPAQAALPSELPVQTEPGHQNDGTPGDRLRPRWQQDLDPSAVIRGWKDGAQVAQGALTHGPDGTAHLSLQGLAPGAYRIHYRTRDAFGATFETQKDLLVAGAHAPVPVAAMLRADAEQAEVGTTVHLLAFSGLAHQPYTLRFFRDDTVFERRDFDSASAPAVIDVPITPELRGGFSVELAVLRDHQLITRTTTVRVPWDDKELQVSFSSFRDHLRPGGQETWKVKVSSPTGKPVEKGAAEVLAFMYDQALDIFGPLDVPSPVALYATRSGMPWSRSSITTSSVSMLEGDWYELPQQPDLSGDSLRFLEGYGIGGMGLRRGIGYGVAASRALPPPMVQAMKKDAREANAPGAPPPPPPVPQPAANAPSTPAAAQAQGQTLRSNFSETAFWYPQLVTGADGSVEFSFTVPDSVTGWNVWASAITRDFTGGSVHAHAESSKPLMARPYLPRFLREGDRAELEVVVNNASPEPLTGRVRFDILDPKTEKSLAQDFELAQTEQRFSIQPHRSAKLVFPIHTPARPGPVAIRAVAETAKYSDGELRPLPVLPSRVHLTQSRFVTLHDADTRTMQFPDLTQADPTRINDQLVVTVDAQLFYQVLAALPYLVDYPYECTEQTLNRFLSTGIVSSLYGQYPAVAAMAKKLSTRTTPLETWSATDPNRKMALEETPWLVESQGGKSDLPLINVLDPRIAKAQRDEAIQKLQQEQTSIGAFPWFPGGPPSPYMTLYLMYGFAKAANFGVPVPKELVTRGWSYLGQHFHDTFKNAKDEDRDWEFLTFLNYVASSYPDASWTGDALTLKDREHLLAISRRHWRDHSPYLKAMLAWTLQRMGHPDEAKKVFASVMDSAKTTRDEGTFWTREDRSWLWYRDTIESHAFALRTLMALEPKDPRREGLVQWLFLHKKLNHWESTRATAEVLTALVEYLKSEHELGTPEDATVIAPPQEVHFTFDPNTFSGKGAQVVVPGSAITPKDATVTVTKQSKGLAFASASWTFSTEKLPAKGDGDFFSVERSYFRRVREGNRFVLHPLEEGEAIAPGDEIEVHLSIRTKHEAEYVQLRDPRAAGMEPEDLTSGYHWDLGLGYYEEIRDSGANFFFEVLPVGEYTFHYRLRANLPGTFRIGPATLQSMYAPEFNAYSAGATVKIGEASP